MALSSKRPWVVTWPDVEEVLVHWVKHMEEKGETVNGPMLRVKREWFEKQMDVLENERLTGDGWVANFCSAYKIKEFRRHGEVIDGTSMSRVCFHLPLQIAAWPPSR